jgi:drug/metabolite transporter (DMT)-like permease
MYSMAELTTTHEKIKRVPFRLIPPSGRTQGIVAAFLTPLFLGVAPIFGKFAINAGADPFSVAAARTVIAVALLWGVYGLFFRKYIYIYPAGLLGCIVVGTINGIGSLFFYGGLNLLDASLSQLLNGMYLVIALLLTRLGGEQIDRRTAVRVGLAMIAIVMITGLGAQPLNFLGVGLMLANALMFAGTVILSQFVLREMPAPTAALYILSTMAVIVVMAWAGVGRPLTGDVISAAFPSIVLLGVTTALSRLTLFASVQVFGSLRTAIIAVAEIGVALGLAYFVLGDRLTAPQVAGIALLMISLLLIRTKDLTPRLINPNTLLVRDIASLQFQRIAFYRAFGKAEHDNDNKTMTTLTTQDMRLIKHMMGAGDKPVDPFPISSNTVISANEIEAILGGVREPKHDTGE